MLHYWLFIANYTGLRKSLCTDRKGNPLYSFWSWMLSWVFVWSQIYRNQWSQTKPIFNRIISCPPVQKFFLCLQKYDFQLQYLPNKGILVSDTLSRFDLSHSKPEFTENSLIHHVHFVLFNFPISETHLKHFQLETKINMPFCKLLSLTQPMNGQKSTSYPQIHIYVIPTEVILLSVKVSVRKTNRS